MRILFYYIVVIFIINLNYNLNAQAVSQSYLDIFEQKELTNKQKEKKFDSLIKANKQNNNFEALFLDIFDILRWYASQGNYQKAIELNKRNLFLMDSINYDNVYFYRRNIYSLGYYQKRVNDILASIGTQKLLLQYKQPDEFAIKGAFQLGEMYFNIGEHYEALNHYELSKTISHQLNNHVFVVKNALDIAVTHRQINTTKSLNKGIKLLTEIAEYVNIINTDDDLKNDIRLNYVQEIYNQLGNLYNDREDYDFANSKLNYDIALELAYKLNNTNLLATINNDIGVLYVKDKSPMAETYLLNSLNLATDKVLMNKTYRNLANHYINVNDFEKADNCIQKSLECLLPSEAFFNNTPIKDSLRASNKKLDLLFTILVKADISLAKAEFDSINQDLHFNKAITTLKIADFLVDQARLESNAYKSKLFWRKTASEIYIKATRACLFLNIPEDAFYFIEKNKAFLLLEDIVLKESRNKSNIPETILKREADLRASLNKLKASNDSNKDNLTLSQLILATDSYNQFIDSLDTKYRLYFKSTEPEKVIDFKSFYTKYVTNDNVFIEYILDNVEGYGLLISKHDTYIFKIKDCSKLKGMTFSYRQLLKTPQQDKNHVDRYKTISNAIFKSLFPDEILPLINNKKINIVPDYYLQNIPFESLYTSNKNNSYLIYQNEISYAYSLSFLNENSKFNRTNTSNFVGFAPVNFPSNLPSLPYTKAELASIKSLFSSELFLNENATKTNFINNSNNSKIIHIASHANANDSISPWIAFHDSRINLEELYELNNSADLVVLSACNTSLGELFKGEGVMSLSRSFFNMGSNSVLPTLWEVNDKSSVDLLSSFYENIEKGQNKSEALHNAKLDYLNNNVLSQASPHYWASFVLIGDTGTIQLNSKWSFLSYIIAGFIFLSIILIGLILKKRMIK